MNKKHNITRAILLLSFHVNCAYERDTSPSSRIDSNHPFLVEGVNSKDKDKNIFSEFEEGVNASPRAIVVVGSSGCPSSSYIVPHATRCAHFIEDAGIDFIVTDEEGYSDEEVIELNAWMRKKFGFPLYPSVGVFEHGRIIDANTGGRPESQKAFDHLLYRHGVISKDPGYALSVADMSDEEKSDYVPRIERIKHLQAHDFSSLDLSHRDLSYGVYSGSDFRFADLSGTSFDHSTLYYVNLCGVKNAHLATFLDVRWGETICPDGTYSSDHGETCNGHMNRAEDCM